MELFKNIYEYRELLKSDTKKEVGGKYKKSFLGLLWSFIYPVLQILVYALVFGAILKNPQENYTVFLCLGLIPWTYFSGTIAQATGIFLANGGIIKKVYFPREVLVISNVTSNTITFLISSIIILAFVIFSGIGISWHILFYPIILLIMYIMLIGISFIVSAITVYIRDLQHLMQIALQLMFYGTPILYSAENLPEIFKKILLLNPMTHIIDAFRDIFYFKQIPNFKALGIVTIFSLILFDLGYRMFKKLQKGFAEEL